MKERCPLCYSNNFKPGGFADICRNCNTAFGPFGGVPIGEDKTPWAWHLLVGLIAFNVFIAMGL